MTVQCVKWDVYSDDSGELIGIVQQADQYMFYAYRARPYAVLGTYEYYSEAVKAVEDAAKERGVAS